MFVLCEGTSFLVNQGGTADNSILNFYIYIRPWQRFLIFAGEGCFLRYNLFHASFVGGTKGWYENLLRKYFTLILKGGFYDERNF